MGRGAPGGEVKGAMFVAAAVQRRVKRNTVEHPEAVRRVCPLCHLLLTWHHPQRGPARERAVSPKAAVYAAARQVRAPHTRDSAWRRAWWGGKGGSGEGIWHLQGTRVRTHARASGTSPSHAPALFRPRLSRYTLKDARARDAGSLHRNMPSACQHSWQRPCQPAHNAGRTSLRGCNQPAGSWARSHCPGAPVDEL